MSVATVRSRSDVTRELVTELERRRLDAVMTDVQFARKLGISRSTWAHMRDGRIQAGPDILLAVANVYPELRPLVAEAKQHCRGVAAIEKLSALGIFAVR